MKAQRRYPSQTVQRYVKNMAQKTSMSLRYGFSPRKKGEMDFAVLKSNVLYPWLDVERNADNRMRESKRQYLAFFAGRHEYAYTTPEGRRSGVLEISWESIRCSPPKGEEHSYNRYNDIGTTTRSSIRWELYHECPGLVHNKSFVLDTDQICVEAI
jgi:hypothetical protein